MTLFDILAAAAPVAEPGHLNPVKLFFDADIIVQAVLIGLIVASIWVWMIIISFTMRMRRIEAACGVYETEFWTAPDFDALQQRHSGEDIPFANVAAAGMKEWKASTAKAGFDREGLRERLSICLDSEIATEADRLSKRLTFLASVGSVAPFVGLFGTVWGIMNSFFQIGQQQNSSLAIVAPGISEALFATAVGLFAAIPATIAYNTFSHRIDAFERSMQRFADRLLASLSRELDA